MRVPDKWKKGGRVNTECEDKWREAPRPPGEQPNSDWRSQERLLAGGGAMQDSCPPRGVRQIPVRQICLFQNCLTNNNGKIWTNYKAWLLEGTEEWRLVDKNRRASGPWEEEALLVYVCGYMVRRLSTWSLPISFNSLCSALKCPVYRTYTFFVKFIPKYCIFDAIMNGIIFPFYYCLLLVCRHTTMNFQWD